jgi:hypothetical protein
MGNNASSMSIETRCEAQKDLERSMGMQIVPIKTLLTVSPSPIQFLAIGTFKNGEFHQIGNLSVETLLQAQVEPEKKNVYFPVSQRKCNFTVSLLEGWYTEELSPEQLNMLVFASDISLDKRLHGIKKNVYIVQKVYKSFNFLISDGINVIRHKDPNTPQMYGYKLKKYTIDKNGHFKYGDSQLVY